MTPQATKLYFELLDEQSNKLAAFGGSAVEKMLAELSARAGRLGVEVPREVNSLRELKNVRDLVGHAETLGAKGKMPTSKPGFWGHFTQEGRAQHAVHKNLSAQQARLDQEYAAAKNKADLLAAQRDMHSTHAARMHELNPDVPLPGEGGPSKGGPSMLALGAGGLALGAGGLALGHQMGQASGAEEANANNSRNKWLSYGGGLATGLAAPSILQGVNSFVGSQGFLPGGSYGGGGENPDFTSI